MRSPWDPCQVGVFALSLRSQIYWVLGKLPTGPGRPQHVQPISRDHTRLLCGRYHNCTISILNPSLKD